MPMETKQEQPHRDVIGEVLLDHTEIKRLFVRIETSQGHPKREASRALFRKLAVHETAEQVIIHPLVRKAVDGNTVADLYLEEEHQARQAIAELEKMDLESAEFDARLFHLKLDVLAHADSEEHDEHPRIRQVWDEKQLLKLATAYRAAEAVAQPETL